MSTCTDHETPVSSCMDCMLASFVTTLDAEREAHGKTKARAEALAKALEAYEDDDGADQRVFATRAALRDWRGGE